MPPPIKTYTALLLKQLAFDAVKSYANPQLLHALDPHIGWRPTWELCVTEHAPVVISQPVSLTRPPTLSTGVTVKDVCCPLFCKDSEMPENQRITPSPMAMCGGFYGLSLTVGCFLGLGIATGTGHGPLIMTGLVPLCPVTVCTTVSGMACAYYHYPRAKARNGW